MNITEVSLETYKNMSLKEKIDFYKKIKSDNDFIPAIRQTKTKNMKTEGYKQLNGRLTFIDELRRVDKKVTNFYYLCICDCGNWYILTNRHFDKEDMISCGCYRKERGAKMLKELGTSQYIDLLNQTFGDLTVIEKTDIRIRNSIVWKCKCNNCGRIQLVNGDMLRYNKRSFCEKCSIRKSRGERDIAFLLDANNIPYIKEKSFNNCRFIDTNRPALFDFYVNNKYIIEFDGEQHFQPERFYNNITKEEAEQNFKKVQEHDKFKTQWCKENNIPLIRIPYIHYNDLCIEDLLLETSNFIIS